MPTTFVRGQPDPATEITLIAIRQNRAVATAVEALQNIAMLKDTAPLAAEMALQGLRDLKEIVVDA